jgi:hypothetical protein
MKVINIWYFYWVENYIIKLVNKTQYIFTKQVECIII